MQIKDKIRKLKSEIPSDVGILAATKTRSKQQIKEAINSGINIFGENYIQEAEKKYSELKMKLLFELRKSVGYMVTTWSLKEVKAKLMN